jgi:predicted nucleic acid-binding protein
VALRACSRGRRIVDGFAILTRDRAEPVLVDDVREAAADADIRHEIEARDLVHLAVMRRIGSDRTVSADRRFDRIDGITRLDNAHVAEWREGIAA